MFGSPLVNNLDETNVGKDEIVLFAKKNFVVGPFAWTVEM
jgi:hypothetical protein